METMQWLTLVIFAVTIVAVVTNVIDSTLAGMIGVTVMIWAGVMTDEDAFKYVDWNVMAILVSIWLIAGYFGKSGVPSWLSVQALKLSGGRPGLLVMILTFLAGVISMFVDNVVTILMMAPVALPLARAMKIPAVPVILMIGFGANFMGTALIIGDLPPQMLHSVAGAEFFDFIWQHGRPSSFPILMLTFALTLAGMYAFALWDEAKQQLVLARDRVGKKPLNYALTRSGLAFCSELDPLARHPDIDHAMDLEALELYLQCQFIPAPWTIYRDIRKLPAAHYAIYDRNGLRIERYWEVDYREKIEISEADALDERATLALRRGCGRSRLRLGGIAGVWWLGRVVDHGVPRR